VVVLWLRRSRLNTSVNNTRPSQESSARHGARRSRLASVDCRDRDRDRRRGWPIFDRSCVTSQHHVVAMLWNKHVLVAFFNESRYRTQVMSTYSICMQRRSRQNCYKPATYTVWVKEISSWGFLIFFPKRLDRWEFLVQILHAYYTFLSTLDYRFLARDSIYATARYMPSPVRLSVRLYVTRWISQRRLKYGSRNLHHRVAPWL